MANENVLSLTSNQDSSQDPDSIVLDTPQSSIINSTPNRDDSNGGGPFSAIPVLALTTRTHTAETQTSDGDLDFSRATATITQEPEKKGPSQAEFD